ncbi:MAG: hypothetical protein JKP92_06205, partial [Alphaproteobacteria bacterium]|nr:hypothetical protein [Alphaproteobacteria bacterium]
MAFVRTRAGQVVFRADTEDVGTRALRAVALAARGIAALHAQMDDSRAAHARLRGRITALERRLDALTAQRLASPPPAALQDNAPVARPASQGGMFSRVAAGLAFGLLLALLVG